MTVIESSAMNVAVGGTYSFDETIDYTLGFACATSARVHPMPSGK